METETKRDRNGEMEKRAQAVRELRERREALEKQIAQLLAESRVTCAELPEIWAHVQHRLVVQAKD